MNSFKRIVILLIIFFLGLGVVFLSNEWNRAAFGSEGHIEKGTKFGLSIGDSKKEITEYLVDRGMIEKSGRGANETGYNPQSCHLHIYVEKYEVELWADESWRRGTICVAYLDGKLTRVSWIYSMLSP